MQALADSYKNKKSNIDNVAEQLDYNLQILAQTPPVGSEPNFAALDKVIEHAWEYFDPENGGFGGAPKFPPSLDLGFWARYYHRTAKIEVLDRLTFTLEKMAAGGIYDQLRGGFHRYTVDAVWLVPHFEKMLYDNAQLAQRYLEAYQITGDNYLADIARETLDYVLAEMTSPEGAFYAAQDADSEGVEGKFFVWTPEEIAQVVGPDRAPFVNAAFGVVPGGNFEHGSSVLHCPKTEMELARQFSLTADQVRENLAQARRQLLAAREKRIRPHRDEKIITAWNGLMISAMACGGQILGNDLYHRAAAGAANFILDREKQVGRLQRTWGATEKKGSVFLDDYAFFITGLLDLFETDFSLKWLEAALRLAQEVEVSFYDQEAGGYFSTPLEHEELLVRPKNFIDMAIPSGNSVMVYNLIRLYRFTENGAFLSRAKEMLSRLQELMLNNPRALTHLASAQEEFLSQTVAITLVGEIGDPAVQEMLAVIYRRYLPHRRLVVKNPRDYEKLLDLVPAAREYEQIDGKPTAFVCQGYTCLAPVQTAVGLGELLDSLARS